MKTTKESLVTYSHCKTAADHNDRLFFGDRESKPMLEWDMTMLKISVSIPVDTALPSTYLYMPIKLYVSTMTSPEDRFEIISWECFIE